jgi:hypothetical protein
MIITVTPGTTLLEGVPHTTADLNLLGNPTVQVEGDLELSDIVPHGAEKHTLAPHFVGTVTGTANAIVIGGGTGLEATALAGGLWLWFVPASNSTSATVTVNVSSLGVKDLVRRDGSALVPGDLTAGRPALITYSTTLTKWLLENPTLPERSIATDTSVAANTLTATLPWTIAAYADIANVPFLLKVNLANTGAATLNINSLGAAGLKGSSGLPLGANELRSGDMVPVVYDGSNFRVLSAAGGSIQNGSVTGLRMTLTSNTTITVDCDYVTMVGSTGTQPGAAVTQAGVITTSGAGGLDNGAEASNTWYFVHLIGDGSQVKALLSTSSTAPTMPGGYSFRMLVGAVHNDSGSNFGSYVVFGDKRVLVGKLESIPALSGTTTVTLPAGMTLLDCSWQLYCAANSDGFTAGDTAGAASVSGFYSTTTPTIPSLSLKWGGATATCTRWHANPMRIASSGNLTETNWRVQIVGRLN